MEKINLIPRVKELYERGENIISFLKKNDGRDFNTIEDILISYDFQAGSYVKFVQEHPQHNTAYTTSIAAVLNTLGPFSTLLEAGVGEATTLTNLAANLSGKTLSLLGFDISWSRIHFGRNYSQQAGRPANLFVADLFNVPLADSSVDIVYTSHSIEPNGGREKEALVELYRITKNYLVLLEPTFEFADDAGKERMQKNGYVQQLKKVIDSLGYDLITYRPFDVIVNPLNPTGLYIIKKKSEDKGNNSADFHCPISGDRLQEFNDHYFSPASLISYPKIMGIPCLCASYGVLTSKHE